MGGIKPEKKNQLFKILFQHLTYLGRVVVSSFCFIFLFFFLLCFLPPSRFFLNLLIFLTKMDLFFFFFLTLVSISLLKSVGYISFLFPSSLPFLSKKGNSKGATASSFYSPVGQVTLPGYNATEAERESLPCLNLGRPKRGHRTHCHYLLGMQNGYTTSSRNV